jgi:hypothetical protein
MTINGQWGDDESRWKNPAYLQWLQEIWHVEIKEQARHLWPGQWTINGYWEDEKQLYKKYEREWEKSCQEAWEKKHPRKATDDSLSLQTLANGDALLNEGEDYFHWNVEMPSWSMHRDGSWQKMLIDMRDWKGKTKGPVSWHLQQLRTCLQDVGRTLRFVGATVCSRRTCRLRKAPERIRRQLRLRQINPLYTA